MKNIFEKTITDETINRINKLTPNTQRVWGKMSVAQMLAHCSAIYEMNEDPNFPKPNFIVKFFVKVFAKPIVVGEKPYKKGIPTAPQFVVKEDKDFEFEKSKLVDFIIRTQKLGEDHFDAKESPSFGKLSKEEWSNLFYKHVDHHLTQFGV